MEPGFYKIPEADYHSGPGISRSGLVRVLRSPAHYKTPVEDTPTLKFGRDFHKAVLEPKRFDKDYLVLPDECKKGSGNGQKSRLEEFKASAEAIGKVIVNQKDFDAIRFMRDAVFNHPKASALLTDGEAELSGYWNDPDNPDILCKLRLDYINKSDRVIVDLKKVTDARKEAFTRIAYAMGYHMESFWYCYGTSIISRVEHRDFRFICVENEAPWGCKVYKASEAMILEGGRDCAKALQEYIKCFREDQWPGYPQDIEEVDLPGYVKRKEPTMIME